MDTSQRADKPKGIEFYGGYEVYSESGVDLTLLRENLRLSLEERWQRGQRARRVGGLTVRFLWLDGLNASKQASGRRLDRLHLLELEKLKETRDAAVEGGAAPPSSDSP